MDAKEKVQQGLDARKNVRVAEAKAEQLRAEVNAANDARFRDQMRYRQAYHAWQYEREDLHGTISRQRHTIRQLREENEKLAKRDRDERQRRLLLSATKSVVFFGLLLLARNKDLVVYWLADSLLSLSATWFFCAIIALTHKKN